MPLTNKQLKAVELMFEGRMTNIKIAEELNVTERTIYNWKKDPDFNDAFIQMGNQTITASVGKLVNNMIRIALDGKSDYVQVQASQYLLDKAGVGVNPEIDVNVKPVEIVDDIKAMVQKNGTD